MIHFSQQAAGKAFLNGPSPLQLSEYQVYFQIYDGINHFLTLASPRPLSIRGMERGLG